MLPTVKAPSTRIIIVLRLSRESAAGSVAPEMATASANMLTNRPAVARSIKYSSASSGNTPMTPVSVHRMPNVPSTRMGTRARLRVPAALLERVSAVMGFLSSEGSGVAEGLRAHGAPAPQARRR